MLLQAQSLLDVLQGYLMLHLKSFITPEGNDIAAPASWIFCVTVSPEIICLQSLFGKSTLKATAKPWQYSLAHGNTFR